jgi:hypothetical protein
MTAIVQLKKLLVVSIKGLAKAIASSLVEQKLEGWLWLAERGHNSFQSQGFTGYEPVRGVSERMHFDRQTSNQGYFWTSVLL